MKMNKYAVLVLIFFLFFSFYLRQVRANASTSGGSESDGYDMSAYYQNQYGEGSVPFQAPEEIASQVSSQAAQFSIQFLAMAFQLFGIVVLGILLIVIVEELIKSNA